MITINLLPKAEKKVGEQKQSSPVTKPIIFGIFLILIIGAGLFGLKILISSQNKVSADKIEAQKQELDQFKETEQKINDFNSSIATTKQLIDKRADWYTPLKELANITPEKMQLTEFKMDPKVGIIIQGKADSERTIMKFFTKLENSQSFTSPVFVNSKLEAASKGQPAAFSFEINAKLKGTSK